MASLWYNRGINQIEKPPQAVTWEGQSDSIGVLPMSTLPQTRTCCDCKEVKPVGDFYLRTDGRNYNSVCKSCLKARNKGKNVTLNDKLVSTVESENLLLSALHRQGVPALPGKAISHKWADVLAWGIVRIEVKYSRQRTSGGYLWHFTPTQTAQGVRGDVIVLIGESDHQTCYYLFLPDSLVFYGLDGHKTALTYPRYKRADAPLINQLFDDARENWELITQARDLLCTKLQNGQLDITRSA